jgi:hypothetical protein
MLNAAALEVFAGIRRRLADELGVPPGAGLREAHALVLRSQQMRMGTEPRARLRFRFG